MRRLPPVLMDTPALLFIAGQYSAVACGKFNVMHRVGIVFSRKAFADSDFLQGRRIE